MYCLFLLTASSFYLSPQEDMVCLSCTATGERVCLAAEGFGNRHCYLETIADKVSLHAALTSCRPLHGLQILRRPIMLI